MCKFYFEQKNFFFSHFRQPRPNIFVTRQERKAKLGNYSRYSKNTKLMQVSIGLLDRTQDKIQPLNESASNVEYKYF